MRNNQDDSEALELIEELELSEPSQIARVQVRDAIEMRVAMTVEDGNASDRVGESLRAETREVSRQRVRFVCNKALNVGDVYVAKFDRAELAVADSYSLCVSCRMLRDQEYETQLDFFTPIDLSQITAAGQ